MHVRDLDERSRRLGERVDAFARALSGAGVDAETASRLLETAATAALHALTLELLLAEPAAPATVPASEPAPVERLPAEPPVRVAAAAA
ncbi:MAG TPA: hypothetical protein VFJ91_05885 [Gaiellaceae bacterium]|nr:hypothetical protein [Gaiellaceae bacterium]